MNSNFIENRKRQIAGKVPGSTIAVCCFDEAPDSKHFIDCGACMYLRTWVHTYCVKFNADIPPEVFPLGCGEGEPDDIPF